MLTARVQNGIHTLLTAQRRMGKTSLVRELLRRLAAEGRFETIFVDHPVPIDDVLRVLEHDGYLEPRGDGCRFVSGLLEDWWRARHGRHFVPIERRSGSQGA